MSIFKIFKDPYYQSTDCIATKAMEGADITRSFIETDHLEDLHQAIENYLLDNKNLQEIPRDELKSVARSAVYAPYEIDAMYTVHRIPKDSGGYRVIEAPSDTLKAIQRVLLRDVIYKELEPSYMAYGFIPHRNVKHNALKHGTKARQNNTHKWLWKMDLRDFFPSVTSLMLLTAYNRERSMMRMLCSSNPEAKAALFRIMMVVYLCFYKERLPQGAPTSPALSNFAMKPTDIAIAGIIKQSNLNVKYTRYADDICISGDYKDAVCLAGTITTHYIPRNTSCTINPKKTALCCHGRPMRVTGVNINHGTTISRWKRDHVRGRLHRAVKQGSITYKDKAQLTGYMAHYKNIDELGWERRCGDLFRKMRTLPVTGA